MEAEKIKKITVDKFHDEYIKKFKNSSYPLFSIIEFNLHGSCSRRCAFCPRVDEKLWPNLDEELDINFFETLCKQLKELDYNFFSGVPCSYQTNLINYALNFCDFIMSANEGDAVATCSGAYLAGKKPVVLMQNSGLGNAVSPLTSLNHTFDIPILGFISPID